MRDTTSPSQSALGDHLASRLLEQRIIVLDGELDDRGGTRLCSQLFLLSAEDPRADISLWINSPGGSVPAMLAIHDAMRLVPNDVSTLALGLACSAGQFLLTAGTHGKRYRPAPLADPHAPGVGRYRWHGRRHPAPGRGPAVHRRDRARADRRAHGPAARADPGGLGRDRWYSAEQALEYGFIDRVLDSLESVRPRRLARTGLRVCR